MAGTSLAAESCAASEGRLPIGRRIL